MTVDRDFKDIDPEKIESFLQILAQRIAERFPTSELLDTANQLLEIAKIAKERTEWISRPIISLRILSACLTLGIVGIAGTALSNIKMADGNFRSLSEFLQGIEAGINTVILISAAIFFLVTLESRIKRGRALKAIHEIRSVAHLIDMHQLNKDPQRLLYLEQLTPSSPGSQLTAFELSRFLDYCSELLSLSGKVAALYVRSFHDPVALAAVNDIEELTTGLSRKIWQKVMILHMSSDASHLRPGSKLTRQGEGLAKGSAT